MVYAKNANSGTIRSEIDSSTSCRLFAEVVIRELARRSPGFTSMIPATQLLNEIAASLRTVIAPAIVDPYPKAQAYMAAVILEFVTRQVEERSDIENDKRAAMLELMRDLSRLPQMHRLLRGDHLSENGLCELIGHLYAERDALGEETFGAANRRVRATLRQLLDLDLKVADKAES